MGTILTPDGMLIGIAYTTKRKHECSVLLLKFGEFKCKDYIAMLFLLTAFALESECKNTAFFWIGEIFRGNNRGDRD